MAISDYQFLSPTRIEFGCGKSRKVGEFMRLFTPGKILLVTDQGVRKAGIVEPIERSLQQCGLSYEVFDDVQYNPNTVVVQKALESLEYHQCDVILAVGGGSSIDTAKAIAVLKTNKGNIMDYEGFGKIHTPPLPLVVIPTTAGTGSEVTNSTVITDANTLFKAAVVSPLLFPKMAILDPELTLELPQFLTATTGMDALTHAIESYLSKQTNPICEALALHAIKLISGSIVKAYYVGTDLESRSNILIASMMAGIAFAHARLGNVHAISHALGGIYNIPHGLANAILLPYVMKFNLPACREKMEIVSACLAAGANRPLAAEHEKGRDAIDIVCELNRILNIPDNIKDLQVNLEDMDRIVRYSMRSGNVKVNPRLTGEKDIENIIRQAYQGEI